MRRNLVAEVGRDFGCFGNRRGAVIPAKVEGGLTSDAYLNGRG
jgi:hypothetical protein